MRHTATLAVPAALLALCGSAAHAALIGGVFRTNADASAEASSVVGEPVTVLDLYFGFDESDDILINIGNVDLTTRGGAEFFQQDLFGSTVNTSAQQNPGAWGAVPALEFDTYVSIGSGPDPSGLGSDNSTTSTDPDFAFSPTGLQGGWFATPFPGTDPPEFPGAAPDTANPDTGLFEVFGGRFTLLGDFTDTPDEGILASILNTRRFVVGLDANWVDQAGGDLISTPFFVPAPGAGALFGLAALAATRRRR